MRKTLFILLLIFIIPLTSCGYTVVKNNKNIDIQNIISSGNKKVSYVIKNQLLMNSSKDGKNKINIKLETEKNKSAKEKNVSGTITKYFLTLKAKLTIEDEKRNNIINKSFTVRGDFEVGSRNSQTIIIEKKKTENLTEQLAEQINTFLIIHFENK